MLNHFLWKRVSFKLANIQRWACILIVDFTLHKINLFIGTKYALLERMIILHTGYNEGFVPNARKNHFITYKTYFPILK